MQKVKDCSEWVSFVCCIDVHIPRVMLQTRTYTYAQWRCSGKYCREVQGKNLQLRLQTYIKQNEQHWGKLPYPQTFVQSTSDHLRIVAFIQMLFSRYIKRFWKFANLTQVIMDTKEIFAYVYVLVQWWNCHYYSE